MNIATGRPHPSLCHKPTPWLVVAASLLVLVGTPDDGTYASDRPASPAAGTVVAVHDGDTVSIRLGGSTERVRLLGIDAPELGQKPWGPRAKRHLRNLVRAREVTVETDIERRDKHGRLLAYVWTLDGRLVNAEMVLDGYALLYTLPPNVRYADSLENAQEAAQRNRKGIWGEEGLRELPRSYRKEHPRE